MLLITSLDQGASELKHLLSLSARSAKLYKDHASWILVSFFSWQNPLHALP